MSSLEILKGNRKVRIYIQISKKSKKENFFMKRFPVEKNEAKNKFRHTYEIFRLHTVVPR